MGMRIQQQKVGIMLQMLVLGNTDRPLKNWTCISESLEYAKCFIVTLM